MGTMTSQINSLTIVYSTVYSGADQRKHQSSASRAFVCGIQSGFTGLNKTPLVLRPHHKIAQMTSNAENVSNWWRHHGRSELCWVSLRCDLINSFWSSAVIWRHRSGSTFAQVMAYFRTAPNHHMNQYRLIIRAVLWHYYEGNFTGKALDIYPWYELDN